jgi:hypothetical protein
MNSATINSPRNRSANVRLYCGLSFLWLVNRKLQHPFAAFLPKKKRNSCLQWTTTKYFLYFAVNYNKIFSLFLCHLYTTFCVVFMCLAIPWPPNVNGWYQRRAKTTRVARGTIRQNVLARSHGPNCCTDHCPMVGVNKTICQTIQVGGVWLA